ncbi:hypothetical protein M9458_025889, partial [Cirrhinus mrigala]
DCCYEQCLSNIPRPPPVPIHLSSTQKSWRSIWRSRMCLVNKQPPIFHHIGHGTAPSNCCLELNYLRERSSARRWR